jgi:hypothetical protein
MGLAKPPAADAPPGEAPATLGEDGEQAVKDKKEQLMTTLLNCLKLMGNLTICTSSNTRTTDLRMLSGNHLGNYINNMHILVDM